MSRTGKKPVVLPEKVKAYTGEGCLFVEGPLGKSRVVENPRLEVSLSAGQIVIKRRDESREAGEAHGMFRSLVQNMVYGVSAGFKKNLEIEGLGYRAEVKGSALHMTLGFSHPVFFAIPQGIKIAVEKQTRLTITGNDKILVGQVAADIRSLRPPEPYKGKGIRYEGEVIERKVGKAAATAGATGGGK